jgi:hypothetical protein
MGRREDLRSWERTAEWLSERIGLLPPVENHFRFARLARKTNGLLGIFDSWSSSADGTTGEIFRSCPFEIMANDELLHGCVMRVHHRDKPGRKTVARRHLNYLFGVVVCH